MAADWPVKLKEIEENLMKSNDPNHLKTFKWLQSISLSKCQFEIQELNNLSFETLNF